MPRYKTIIGSYELIDFPDQILVAVPAKTDTGANISAIHATEIKEITRQGKQLLQFKLLASHTSYDYERVITVDKYRVKTIENSFGQSEKRYVVRMKVKVAKRTFRTDFTLANRSKKTFPILLGREMLDNRFIVDTAICNIPKKLLEQRMPRALRETDED